MTHITLYHNPRCSKSRQALALLTEHQVEPTIRLYLEQPPSEAELGNLLQLLGISARDLIRRGEGLYRELHLDRSDISEAELIRQMAAHPILIERPIAVSEDRAVIGRPAENLLALLP